MSDKYTIASNVIAIMEIREAIGEQNIYAESKSVVVAQGVRNSIKYMEDILQICITNLAIMGLSEKDIELEMEVQRQEEKDRIRLKL